MDMPSGDRAKATTVSGWAIGRHRDPTVAGRWHQCLQHYTPDGRITSAVIGFWIPVVRQFNLRFFVSFGGKKYWVKQPSSLS